MSLYNMMHGFDHNATQVLANLDLLPKDIPRFRDAYPDPVKNVLVILTRTGGGNRADYEKENDKLAAHPRCTCATTTMSSTARSRFSNSSFRTG